MMNNQYKIKRRMGLTKAVTEKDQTIMLVGRLKQVQKKPRTLAKIVVNGKQLTSHYSHFKTIESTQTKKSTDLQINKSPKKFDLNQYIFRKYLSENENHSDKLSEEHSQKLIRLRKIFNDKYKAPVSKVIHRSSKSPLLNKHLLQIDSHMIRITNPEIYSYTFMKRFQQTKHLNKSEFIQRNQTIKYRAKDQRKDKHSRSKRNETPSLIQPWEVD